jgi:hypothetical protein
MWAMVRATVNPRLGSAERPGRATCGGCGRDARDGEYLAQPGRCRCASGGGGIRTHGRGCTPSPVFKTMNRGARIWVVCGLCGYRRRGWVIVGRLGCGSFGRRLRARDRGRLGLPSEGWGRNRTCLPAAPSRHRPRSTASVPEAALLLSIASLFRQESLGCDPLGGRPVISTVLGHRGAITNARGGLVGCCAAEVSGRRRPRLEFSTALGCTR